MKVGQFEVYKSGLDSTKAKSMEKLMSVLTEVYNKCDDDTYTAACSSLITQFFSQHFNRDVCQQIKKLELAMECLKTDVEIMVV